MDAAVVKFVDVEPEVLQCAAVSQGDAGIEFPTFISGVEPGTGQPVTGKDRIGVLDVAGHATDVVDIERIIVF